ncbi:putative nucleotide-binding protein (sugar kinase/HSP70/actin superfamily) [Desulfohalotomaculum tongense]|uniref:CoA protein activase n=1 Tax=Desulforadius tongensis TaxID=1216062 RepID=UPI00195CC86A|nr:CoA protein activase [Desulforadius tongensis]MBM7854688.1 putative nucleotide-binding protein (sugar kinase/HSP70/actin superfamily) [Desulforadius tongensis]
MKVTFPHMGNLYICVKGMLEFLDIEVILPPASSKRTLTLGAKYSPEFACMPLKLNLGNLIEASELGADTIMMAGGCGPCRFGYYAQIEHSILQDLGYKYNLVVLEPPEKHITELTSRVRQITGKKSWWKVIQAIKYGYLKSRAVDEVELMSFKIRPRELVTGETDRALAEALKEIDRAGNMQELKLAEVRGKEIMNDVAVDSRRPVIKVALTGEIFTLLEPFANLNIERHLGRLAVEVDRSIYLSEWINDHLFMGLLKGIRSTKEYCRSAAPYLNHFVGGHGLETVGSIPVYARQGYAGVIQVFPFTCMPEIVAESILPKVSAANDIPVMTLIMDEHTGEAGMVTRLEAFVDLLERRQNRGYTMKNAK